MIFHVLFVQVGEFNKLAYTPKAGKRNVEKNRRWICWEIRGFLDSIMSWYEIKASICMLERIANDEHKQNVEV
jgi:hypothetical protein